eukprot:7279730-Alexandrium_andersonii.AAC.1
MRAAWRRAARARLKAASCNIRPSTMLLASGRPQRSRNASRQRPRSSIQGPTACAGLRCPARARASRKAPAKISLSSAPSRTSE